LERVLSYSENDQLASEVAAAAGEVAKMLGTDAGAVELDEVSPGLRSSGKVILLKGDRPL